MPWHGRLLARGLWRTEVLHAALGRYQAAPPPLNSTTPPASLVPCLQDALEKKGMSKVRTTQHCWALDGKYLLLL